ncbi:MAG: hypothetical protein IJX97_00990 [Clostridia bacterium]|nr:hypothetical protein [Clostridia bacterium]
MNNRKYPIDLFVFGFFQNLFFHFFWLFVPALILLIVGIFVKTCLYIGLIILVIDIIASFVEQLLIRKACLSDSDNPDFKLFQDALSADGDWKENIDEYVKNQISKYENESNSDEK